MFHEGSFVVGLRVSFLCCCAAAMFGSSSLPAQEKEPPEAVKLLRQVVQEMKAKDADHRLDLELHLWDAMKAAETETDPRVVDCLLDIVELDPIYIGHHGEFSSHGFAREAAEKRKSDLQRLLSAAEERGPAAKALVLDLLETWRAPEGLAFAAKCLKEGQGRLPFSAVDALGAMPGAEASLALIAAVAAGRECVFRETLTGFERWERLPKTVPYKYARLHPLWVILRPDCIRIHNITDIRESSPLRRWTLGAWALRALANRDEDVPLDDVRKALDSPSLRVQQAAARYLADRYPQAVKTDLAREWKNPYMAGLCAELRAREGDASAAEALLSLAGSKDLLLRVYAVQALADAPGAKADECLATCAGDAETFVGQAALDALAKRKGPPAVEVIASALLSWDAYICGAAASLADSLPDAGRAEVARRVLASRPATPPEGKTIPRDEVTEGGDPEPPIEGEGFHGTSMTTSGSASVEGDTSRVLRLWRLAEGLDGTALRARGREMIEESRKRKDSGPAADALRHLAMAAVALAPTADDADDLSAWLNSTSDVERLIALRGIGALGGSRAPQLLLPAIDKLAAARDACGENPLYVEAVAALAESGDAECWKRFLALAPWTLYPKGGYFTTYTEVEDVASFVAGAVRARSDEAEALLARLERWLPVTQSYTRFAEVLWRGTFRRRPAFAAKLASERLLSGDEKDAHDPLNACSPLLQGDLLAGVKRKVEEAKWEWGLEALAERDREWALGVARRWLDEAHPGARLGNSTALRLVLASCDPADRDRLKRLLPDASAVPQEMKRDYHRCLARQAAPR